MQLRRLICGILAMFAAGFAAPGAQAQSAYPTRPIKLIVTFAPGGTTDIVARFLGAKAGAELGQSVIAENRSGASGAIGMQDVARAAPDGYTIVIITGTNIVTPIIQAAHYNIEKDFVSIIGIGGGPLALAVPVNSGVKSIPDLVAESKRHGGLSFGAGGAGSAAQLAGVLFTNKLGVSATTIQYRGNGPAMIDLMSGRLQFFFPTVTDVLDMAKAGKIRLLGVTSSNRVPALPDVPTMTELGFPEINIRVWNGLLAPAKTPPEIVKRLYDAFASVMAQPDTQERFRSMVIEPETTTGPEFEAFLKSEHDRWQKVITENHITSGG